MSDILSSLSEDWRSKAIIFLVGALVGVGGFGWENGELSDRIRILEDYIFDSLEKRIDAIERMDTVTAKSVEACQAIAKTHSERLNYIERNVWGKQQSP